MVTKSIKGVVFPNQPGEFVADEFIKKYEETFLKAGNRSGFKTKKTFSPSTLGYGHGTCPRYWYIAFTGAEFIEDNDSRGLANMAYGSERHEVIQTNLEKMGVLKHKELEVTMTDPPVRGFIDAIVEWQGKDLPVEIKTANNNSFTFRSTTRKPGDSHYVQFLIYLRALKSEEGFLMYENKDTQEILILPVVRNKKTMQHAEYLIDWMKETYKAFEKKQLPENPFKRKNARVCKGCPVRETCYDADKFGDGVIALPVLEVPKP